jgi:hypothetical protein
MVEKDMIRARATQADITRVVRAAGKAGIPALVVPRRLPRYVTFQRNRHGRIVFYFRKGKGKRFRLPDDPNSKEFRDAVIAANAGIQIPLPRKEPKRHPPGSKASVVYFIGDLDRAVKIGHSVDVTSRKREIQTGCYWPVKILRTIPGGRAEERRMHEAFAETRAKGEWFFVSAKLKHFVRRGVLKDIPEPPTVDADL